VLQTSTFRRLENGDMRDPAVALVERLGEQGYLTRRAPLD
jgi:hypothetical protein